jgi:hypothetical protein
MPGGTPATTRMRFLLQGLGNLAGKNRLDCPTMLVICRYSGLVSESRLQGPRPVWTQASRGAKIRRAALSPCRPPEHFAARKRPSSLHRAVSELFVTCVAVLSG